MAEPAVILLARVARALGDLRERVVFIGGAIAPLLQIDPPFGGARPTTDVDAIAVTVGYSDYGRLQDELRHRGFSESLDSPHAHRWLAPGEPSTKFDLVPAGIHLGASGNEIDQAALDTSVRTELDSSLVIRHASAPGFLALKLAAYRDRGKEDPFTSSDLEDIFALLASRRSIVAETSTAPMALRAFIVEQTKLLLESDDLEDLVAGHLANVDRARAAEVIGVLHKTLAQIATLA
jgi:hypothetical protein